MREPMADFDDGSTLPLKHDDTSGFDKGDFARRYAAILLRERGL